MTMLDEEVADDLVTEGDKEALLRLRVNEEFRFEFCDGSGVVGSLTVDLDRQAVEPEVIYVRHEEDDTYHSLSEHDTQLRLTSPDGILVLHISHAGGSRTAGPRCRQLYTVEATDLSSAMMLSRIPIGVLMVSG